MAQPAIVPPQIQPPSLSYVEKSGASVPFQIVAFAVDGDKASPVTWPTVPAGAEVFSRTAAGFRRFDLAKGIEHGEHFTSLAGAKA